MRGLLSSRRRYHAVSPYGHLVHAVTPRCWGYPHSIRKDLESDSCIKDIRTYRSTEAFPTLLKAIVRDMKLERAKIGVEFGADSHGGQRVAMSYNSFVGMLRALPKVKFVDASDLFWKLRVTKSKAEIACFKRTCEITCKAYEARSTR
jgi:Xaa-Pro aminopeptidase